MKEKEDNVKPILNTSSDEYINTYIVVDPATRKNWSSDQYISYSYRNNLKKPYVKEIPCKS